MLWVSNTIIYYNSDLLCQQTVKANIIYIFCVNKTQKLLKIAHVCVLKAVRKIIQMLMKLLSTSAFRI